MELVVVERIYESPFTAEQAADLKRRVGPCFAMRRISHVQSYFSKDRLRAICMYHAPDAAAVREAHEQEGYPYAKIWSVDTTMDTTIDTSQASETGSPGSPEPA